MGTNGDQWAPMGTHVGTHTLPLGLPIPHGLQWLLWPPVASCGSIGSLVVLMNPYVVPMHCVPEYSVGSFVPPGEGTAWVVFYVYPPRYKIRVIWNYIGSFSPLKSPLDPKETKETPLYTKSNISLCILKKNCCLNGTKLRFN